MGQLTRFVLWAGVVSASVLVLSGTAAGATTWTVCSSGCSFTTIPAAVSAANAGDTVAVHAGTYSGGFTIAKSIRLVGAGATTTIIKGGSPVVTVGNPPIPGQSAFVSVLISGVTIRDGIADDTASFPGSAGGVVNNARLTLSASVVTSNTGFFAGGILNHGQQLELAGSTIRNNHKTGDDIGSGGLYNFGIARINNSTIRENTGGTCAGIYSDAVFGFSQVDLTLSNSSVVGNDAGAICLIAGSYVLRDSTVSNNRGPFAAIQSFDVDATVYSRMVVSNNSGGGIFNGVFPDDIFSNVSIENSRITGNSTQGSGGGVATDVNGSVTISNSTISANSALGDGGGIFGAVTIRESLISKNRAGGFGGGVAGAPLIKDSRVVGNFAGINWGGVFVAPSALVNTIVRENVPNNCPFPC
jgi:hypothetical protein